MQSKWSCNFSVRVAALALVGVLSGVSQTAPSAQKFAGVWVEDESQLKLGGSAGRLRFREAAGGGLEELRGAEAAPLAQPVKFEGKPYAIDGSVNTIEWKKTDDRHFERKIYHEGNLQAVRDIEISADGKTLTQITKATPTGGRKSTIRNVYERTSGGPQGLVGMWSLRSVKTVPASTMRIEAAGADGYKLSDAAGRIYTVKLDGQPVAVEGPTVIAGTMVAARALDDHTIEESDSRSGTPTGMSTMALSADGKTLTVTSVAMRPEGKGEPTVAVYRKR
jgi:hypothetical protein